MNLYIDLSPYIHIGHMYSLYHPPSKILLNYDLLVMVIAAIVREGRYSYSDVPISYLLSHSIAASHPDIPAEWLQDFFSDVEDRLYENINLKELPFGYTVTAKLVGRVAVLSIS